MKLLFILLMLLVASEGERKLETYMDDKMKSFSNNKRNPYQRELRFDAVDHPAEYSWLQCRDYPNWKDGDGDDCEVYAQLVPQDYFDDPYDDEHYTDEYDFCSLFGGWYDSGNTAGLTGFEACCACGGGIPEFELCNNLKNLDGSDWTDAQGRHCDMYEEFHLCYNDGDDWANKGMTADQACCACRGGAIGTCQDYEGFITDIYNEDCSWYNANYNDEIDANTRCHHFGDDVGVYAGGTATTNEACCVCGGGINILDYPSFTPILSSSFTSSSSSSSSIVFPSTAPTNQVSNKPSSRPTKSPTSKPSSRPTKSPTSRPSKNSSNPPTNDPTKNATESPTNNPTKSPTKSLTNNPTKSPTKSPTNNPTKSPTKSPTNNPTKSPTKSPTNNPTKSPTKSPTNNPTKSPTKSPTNNPTKSPTHSPTSKPSRYSASSAQNPSQSPSKSEKSRRSPSGIPSIIPIKPATSQPLTTIDIPLLTTLPTLKPASTSLYIDVRQYITATFILIAFNSYKFI